MTTCQEIQERLGSYLDRELESDERERVRAHLGRCGVCATDLEALERTSARLGDAFRATIAAAPPVPLDLATRTRRRRRAWIPAVGGVAAVLVAAALLVLWPSERVEASPAVLLRLAAAHYLETEDAELWLVTEVPAIEGLARLLGDETVEAKSKGHRILVGPGNRLLLQEAERPGTPWSLARELSGFDGKRAWTWDPEKRVVRLERSPGDLPFSVKSEDGDGGLLRFLSWSFVEDLLKKEDEYEIVEVTGPAAKRAGRRVLELRRKPRTTDDESSSAVWSRSRITIDPSEDRIDKVELDVRWGPINLLRFTVEVGEVNRGLDKAVFGYAHHVPPGTAVEEAPAEEAEDGEEEGEKTDAAEDDGR